MPSPTAHSPHETAIPTVRRFRLRSATPEALAEEETPPPNMSDRPPPRSWCSSTSMLVSRPRTASRIGRMSFSRGRSTWTSTFHCGERTDPAYATGRVRSGPGPRGTAYVGLGPSPIRQHVDQPALDRLISCRSCLTARRSALVTRDLRELLGLQGGPADECTVDVGLAHQLDHVGGLHAAAVQDAHRIGDRVAVLLAQRLTDR